MQDSLGSAGDPDHAAEDGEELKDEVQPAVDEKQLEGQDHERGGECQES